MPAGVSTNAIFFGAATLVSLAAFIGLVLIPSLNAYGRWPEKLAAGNGIAIRARFWRTTSRRLAVSHLRKLSVSGLSALRSSIASRPRPTSLMQRWSTATGGWWYSIELGRPCSGRASARSSPARADHQALGTGSGASKVLLNHPAYVASDRPRPPRGSPRPNCHDKSDR